MKIKITMALLCSISFFGYAQRSPWHVSAPPYTSGGGGIPIHGNHTGSQTKVVMTTTTWRDGIIYAWVDMRNGNRDIYAQKLDPCGNIAPGWPANGLAICTATGPQDDPKIIADTSDGAYIVWEDNRGPNMDIYATHVLGNGTIAGGWIANGTAICTANANQNNPQLTCLSNNNVVFTWDDNRSGNRDVYAKCLSANGTTVWGGANGTALAVIGGAQEYPVITPDSLGGVFLAWEDARPAAQGRDIYGARINAAGTITWTNFIASATGIQNHVSITNVAPGIAMAAWVDDPSECVRVTRFDINGNATGVPFVMGANGILFSCGWGSNTQRTRIAPNGTGGAYISFRSRYSPNDNDVFLGIVQATGTIIPASCVHCMFDNEVNHEMAADGTSRVYTAVQNNANSYGGHEFIQARRYTPPLEYLLVSAQNAGGNGDRNLPAVAAMCGVGYWAWQDSRPAAVSTWDIYASASDTLAPRATLLSSLSSGCSSCCPACVQNFTVCEGTPITFTATLPKGLFTNYTFLDYSGASIFTGTSGLDNTCIIDSYSSVNTIQSGVSNFVTTVLAPGVHTIQVVSSTSSGCVTRGSNLFNITVTPNNTITLSSAPGTDNQTVSVNTPITNITYSTTGATGATITGLPPGVTGNWAANVVTISGTPTVTGTFNYTVTTTGGCGTVIATGTITVTFVLPVNLIFFNMYCKDEQVHLEWATASETNNDFYTIEYSTNGITFIKLLDIHGSGNSSAINTYSYIHNLSNSEKSNKTIYYHLSQTDNDGTQKTLMVKAIQVCKNNIDFNIYPNPAKTSDGLFVDIETGNEFFSGELKIINKLGQIVLNKKIALGGSVKVEIFGLQPGVYTIELHNEGQECLAKKKQIIF